MAKSCSAEIGFADEQWRRSPENTSVSKERVVLSCIASLSRGLGRCRGGGPSGTCGTAGLRAS